MKAVPFDPHAIVQITTPNDGSITYDSWEHKGLFDKVDVELVTNESSQATWTLFDNRFAIIDKFAGTSPVEMSTVRVYLGYGPDLGQPIFKGLLASVTRTQTRTEFKAYDMGFKMKLEKRAGYKAKKDDLAILQELAKRNGLKFEGPENPLKLEPHRSMMQDQQTDWEHVMERARDAGLVIYVRGDTLFAKYPAKVTKPVASFYYRQQIKTPLKSDWEFTFNTPESQDGKPKSVKQRGRGDGGKQLEGVSDEGTRGRESVVLKRDVPGKATKSKLSKRAQAQKDLDREHAFEGRIGSILSPDGKRIDVRDTVLVTGVGKLFSGKYICDRVLYSFAAGQLDVEPEVYRDINA